MSIFLPFFLIILSYSIGSRYLGVPITRIQNATHSAHIIKFEINQYNYDIEIRYGNQQNYILSLDSISRIKTKTDSIDYRKNEQGILGTFNYIGTELSDPRLLFYKRTSQNLYYYFKNFFERIGWVNFKGVKQVDLDRMDTALSEGIMYFGMLTSSDYSLIKYNTFMKKTIVSIKMHDQTNQGTLFFGAFPTEQLQDPSQFFSTSIWDRSRLNWKITSIILNFQKFESKNMFKQVGLFRQMTYISLNVNEKTLQISTRAFNALANELFGCSIKRKRIVCDKIDKKFIQNSRFQLTVDGSKAPLEIRLKDLVVPGPHEGEITLNIIPSDEDNYHIGSFLLNQYMIGVDYTEGIMYYGKKKSQGWIDRYLFIKIVIYSNLILLLASLLVLAFSKNIRKEWQAEMQIKNDKKEAYNPKNSGYLKTKSEQSLSAQEE